MKQQGEERVSVRPYKCPVCLGTALVSIPPAMPGDQETFSSNTAGPWMCTACHGSGLVWR